MNEQLVSSSLLRNRMIAVICKNKTQRDALLMTKNDNSVMAVAIWALMNHLAMCRKGDLTNAEWLEERVVNLPSSARIFLLLVKNKFWRFKCV